MVYIITGATHTGKTTLAKKLVSRTGAFCLSVDHLKMGLIRSGYTDLTPYDDEELTGYLWPVVREMIKTAIENCQDLIVEGCYIPFSWRSDFDSRYLQDIRAVCLAMSRDYVTSRFGDIISHESETEKRITDPSETPDSLIADNDYYTEGFGSSGGELLIIEDDWERAVDAWLGTVD